MRKIDKKLNIKKANLIVEQTYWKNKGIIPENLGYGFQEENQGMCEDPLGECGMGMYEDQTQPEMEYEAPMPIYEEPQINYKESLRQLEPRDIEGKMKFMQELESFLQELRYVIRREQEGI